MSRDLRSLWPVAALAALTLALVVALTRTGAASVIVPPPEQEAESFLVGLRLRSFEAAHSRLSARLQAQVSSQSLADLEQQIEARFGGFYDIESVDAQTQGQTASASVEVQLIDGRQDTVVIPLVFEHGLWRVSSIAPLEELLRP